jgi:hypothetical protein
MYWAIKARYPGLQVIATAGRAALGYFGQAAHTPTGTRPDVIDDHYYGPFASFTASADRYGNTHPGATKFLVGEFGVQEGSPTGDLRAAVGEAAFLTGIERASDVVMGASYAPMLVNENQPNRPTSMIGFDSLRSYGSPSYWMLRMFSTNLGRELVPSTLSGATGVDQVVTKTTTRAGSAFFVKLVNTTARGQAVNISFDDPHVTIRGQTATQLTGRATARNTLQDPTAVVPTTRRLNGGVGSPPIALPPYSITVLRLSTG